ncbi:MAG: hypothetical protein A2Y73_04435 [Chloroflexi bacterium RBG_13_56_8]|nr:MAG: hypothetical protein A2Y73_04435 [Chloroflexi bacterium RBG_13_56_8]
MSKALKYTFLIHALVAAILGAALLITPGRFLWAIGWPALLQPLGWENTDPYLARLLGAALLALAWSSYRGWRATDRAQVSTLIETEAVFTVLGCGGLLRHLATLLFVEGWVPAVGWGTMAILAVFAVAWVVFLFKKDS